MAKRLFLLYVLVETAVMVALVASIGFGATVLVLLGAFLLGVVVAAVAVRGQIGRLASALSGVLSPTEMSRSATDGAFVAAGAALVLIPGLVSTAVGLAMLAPPTRAALRPLAGLIASRTPVGRTVRGAGAFGPGAFGRGSVVDGEVIDGEVIDTDVRDAPVERVLVARRMTTSWPAA